RHTRFSRDWSSDVCSSDLSSSLKQGVTMEMRFLRGDSVATGQSSGSAVDEPMGEAHASAPAGPRARKLAREPRQLKQGAQSRMEIGRASCRERGEGGGEGG